VQVSGLKERVLVSIIVGLQFGIVFFLAVTFWATPGEAVTPGIPGE